MEPPAQRAIAELDRVLDRDLSWRSSFPGLVDIKTAMLKELWDNMGSFSQGLHQAVWDILRNLARMPSGKQTQESRGDWKRCHDRSPPRKFSSRGLLSVVYLTLTDSLRIQPWSHDGRNQTKSNRNTFGDKRGKQTEENGQESSQQRTSSRPTRNIKHKQNHTQKKQTKGNHRKTLGYAREAAL